MTAGALVLQTFTRDVQTALCLDPLAVCYFSAWSRRGLLMYSPSRSGYGFSYELCTVLVSNGVYVEREVLPTSSQKD